MLSIDDAKLFTCLLYCVNIDFGYKQKKIRITPNVLFQVFGSPLLIKQHRMNHPRIAIVILLACYGNICLSFGTLVLFIFAVHSFSFSGSGSVRLLFTGVLEQLRMKISTAHKIYNFREVVATGVFMMLVLGAIILQVNKQRGYLLP